MNLTPKIIPIKIIAPIAKKIILLIFFLIPKGSSTFSLTLSILIFDFNPLKNPSDFYILCTFELRVSSKLIGQTVSHFSVKVWLILTAPNYFRSILGSFLINLKNFSNSFTDVLSAFFNFLFSKLKSLCYEVTIINCQRH